MWDSHHIMSHILRQYTHIQNVIQTSIDIGADWSSTVGLNIPLMSDNTTSFVGR